MSIRIKVKQSTSMPIYVVINLKFTNVDINMVYALTITLTSKFKILSIVYI